MKILFAIAAVILFSSIGYGQRDIDRMVAAERAFAEYASANGTRNAFLEFSAADLILFLPDKVKTADYWNAQGESPGLLSWAPNYADISSNGIIGYTTGNWEFRARGKDDVPAGFGQFVTIWQRMPDGKFKFLIDIGISHDKPAQFSTALMAPSYPTSPNEKRSSAADTANSFFETAGNFGLNKAYKAFAAEKIRGFREGEMPILGKDRFLSAIKKLRSKTNFAKHGVFFGTTDIAYIANTYTRSVDSKVIEKGNFVQIWKLIDGRWQIVLDIFKPIPEKLS